MESNSIIAKFKKNLTLSGRKKDRNVVECFDISQPADAPPQKLTLRAVRAAGRGTFGSVLQAVIEETKETVAVKTVYQDPQYQNRELEIMRRLKHDCIVLLKYYYLSERRNGTYLHLMMEFLPFSLGRVLKYYSRRGEQMPLIYQQVRVRPRIFPHTELFINLHYSFIHILATGTLKEIENLLLITVLTMFVL